MAKVRILASTVQEHGRPPVILSADGKIGVDDHRRLQAYGPAIAALLLGGTKCALTYDTKDQSLTVTPID